MVLVRRLQGALRVPMTIMCVSRLNVHGISFVIGRMASEALTVSMRLVDLVSWMLVLSILWLSGLLNRTIAVCATLL